VIRDDQKFVKRRRCNERVREKEVVERSKREREGGAEGNSNEGEGF